MSWEFSRAKVLSSRSSPHSLKGLACPLVTLKPSSPHFIVCTFFQQPPPSPGFVHANHLPSTLPDKRMHPMRRALAASMKSTPVAYLWEDRNSWCCLPDRPQSTILSWHGIGPLTLHFESVRRHFLKSWCCTDDEGFVADLRLVLMVRISNKAKVGSLASLTEMHICLLPAERSM